MAKGISVSLGDGKTLAKSIVGAMSLGALGSLAYITFKLVKSGADKATDYVKSKTSGA